MDFKTATDKLTEGTTLTLARVAGAFDLTPNSLSRMRTGTLNPPRDWQRTIVRLARQEAKRMSAQGARLTEFATDLEREARKK